MTHFYIKPSQINRRKQKRLWTSTALANTAVNLQKKIIKGLSCPGTTPDAISDTSSGVSDDLQPHVGFEFHHESLLSGSWSEENSNVLDQSIESSGD
jgi:hypothetical protein